MTKIKYLLPLFLVITAVSACKKDEKDPYAETKENIKATYAEIVYANYADAYDEAVQLKAAIDAFVASPTQSNFDAAKTAWLEAREPYGETEAFRFAGGPIDDADGPEGLINAWPLDEAYVDYVKGNSTSGIINDVANYPTITKQLIEGLNQSTGEENVSVGYHAIEFLLWGQDLTSPSALQAGQRPFTDFVNGGSASNQDRRRVYLQLCAELLVEHLEYLKNEWAPSGAYRTTFLALDNNVAITNIITGIGVLSKSELAGERIFTAYDNQDQEDEHSCFSDNTHRDVRLNVEGIKNVYTGTYTKVNGQVVSGASLSELMHDVDHELGEQIDAQLTLAVNKVNATGIPFDNAIVNATERPKVLESVNELRTLGDKFAAAGQALGLNINTDLPE